MTAAYHPWRQMRDLGPSWRLRWEPLPPDTFGLTNHCRRTITLATGMSQAERRCTIAHEVQHALRGPVPPHRIMQEELTIDRHVSGLLMPRMSRVVDSLIWAHGDIEAASDDLWVDPVMLEVRLSALRAHERRYMERRWADVLL